MGKSEGGLDGVVGGMTVIVMLAGTISARARSFGWMIERMRGNARRRIDG